MVLEIPLVVADAMVAAVRQRAKAIDACVSVAVVDEGGNLKTFARMDGAELARIDFARGKA